MAQYVARQEPAGERIVLARAEHHPPAFSVVFGAGNRLGGSRLHHITSSEIRTARPGAMARGFPPEGRLAQCALFTQRSDLAPAIDCHEDTAVISHPDAR